MKNLTLIQLALSVLLLIALSAAYAFWLVRVGEARAESSALAAQIAAMRAEQSGAGASRGELAQLAADESDIGSHFVAADSIVPFLESMESLAARLGAHASVVSVGDPDARGRIQVALSVSGPFDAVMKAVGEIENGPYASATRNLALDASDEGQWRAALVFDINAPTP